jgi:hypothetical protein
MWGVRIAEAQRLWRRFVSTSLTERIGRKKASHTFRTQSTDNSL